ncbi:LamG domain-containing protein [Halapricum hydrolyticum]|uniref:LamG domain-containing protein n=1 Tax=Halapricum hydrolyticum TaxID=2979991 RepID=A0AAE3LIH4_9EURY|nr:LamG domain-containing protein [Halapricum hydrolyticum]MCU4719005.1 LamG domain-containing protein [Halapricum hydrolyticum]MCU4727934.1 LamG domain-containing protein [Halapricum hydrolyticum]
MTVAVAGDADAFLRIAPCDGSPNGKYVANAANGAMAIDLADGDSGVAGSGVNPEARSVFHNVFEICNQGTQPVCADFAVDVPDIPSEAEVPTQYDFGAGDPAIVFYRGGDRNTPVTVDQLDTGRPGAVALDVGECQCFGLEVRAFGFSSGRDLFENANLTIHADAGGGCVSSVSDPVPQILGPTDGLIDYWPLDSIEDGTAEDIVGGNDGTPQDVGSSISTADGQVGNAALFDTSDKYIPVGQNQLVSTSFTVATWVNGYGFDHTDYPLAVSEWQKAQNRDYLIGAHQNGQLYAQFNREPDGNKDTLFGPQPSTNTWYHCVLTYDGTTGKFYVDNSEVDSTTGPFNSTSSDFVIGSKDGGGNSWHGLVDDVRVYDRALSASEVSDLYNATN